MIRIQEMMKFSYPHLRKFFLTILCAFGISGCVPTPYKSQEWNFLGGYSDTKVQEDTYDIHFKGNAFTKREAVIDYALLRSAEVALEHQCAAFAIIDAKERVSTEENPEGEISYLDGQKLMHPVSVYGNFSTASGKTYFLRKPDVVNRILCFKTQPNIDHHIYDPHFITLTLRTKYGIQHAGQKTSSRASSTASQ